MTDTLSITHTPESAQAAQSAAQQQNASEKAAPKWGSTARVVGETARVTVTDGTETRTTDGFAKFNSSDLATSDTSKGIIATARSPLGTPRSGSSIDPARDIVTLPGGTQTTVGAAAAAGFLVQIGNGEWADAGSAPNSTGNSATPKQQEGEPNQQAKQEQEKQQQEGDTPVIEPLDEASEQLLSEFTSKASNVDLVAASRQMVDQGAVSETTLRAVATQLGVTPEEVAARADALHAAFTKQANEAVGPGAEQVWQWARENMPRELRAAVDQQVMNGTTAGYKALLSKHIEDLPRSNPNAILTSKDAAARGVQRDKDGTITVMHPKMGRIDWRTAYRIGHIKPHYY